MLPYWLLFVLTALPAFTASSSSRELVWQQKRSRFGAMLVAACIIFLIGFRYEVGADWWAYDRIFEAAEYQDFFDSFSAAVDPSFVVLNWSVMHLGLGYWVVNLICAMIFTYGLFRFAKQLPNPWLAVAVAAPYLIVVVAMGYTRQGVAIGLAMVGLTAIAETSFSRFVIWILLAATFHKSAIILLPIVALSYTRNRLLVWVGAAVFSILGYYLFIASALEVLLTSYIEQEYESQGAIVRVFMNAVPALIFLMTIKRYPIPLSAVKMWRNFALLAIASVPAVLLLPSTTAIDRLALYLIPMQLFVLSWLPYIFGEKGRVDTKIVFGVLVYCGIVLFVWLNYARHSEGWVPYKLYPLLFQA